MRPALHWRADSADDACMDRNGRIGPAAARVEGLDGLRGIAAMVVLVGHLTADVVAVVGVHLFFVLSAFLLTRQLLDWRAGDFVDPWRLAHFAQRRFFRIYPLLVVVLLVSGVTTWLAPAWLGGEGLPLTVPPSKIAAVMALQAGPNVLWSIAVECKFYFLLPVIGAVLVIGCRRRPAAGLAVLAAAVVACKLWVEPASHSIALAPFLPLFLIGCGAALVDLRLHAGGRSASLGLVGEAAAWLCVAGWLVTQPITQTTLGLDFAPREWVTHAHVFYGLLFAAMILGMVHGQGWMRRGLEIAPLRWLGAISFSLYLLHIGPIRVFDAIPGLPDKLAGVIAAVVSIGLAAMTYRWIERPAMRATRDWFKMRRPAPAPPLAAPSGA